MFEKKLTPEQHIKALGIIHGSRVGYFWHHLDKEIDGSSMFIMDGEFVAIHGKPNGKHPPEPSIDYTLICGDKPAEVFKRMGLMDSDQETAGVVNSAESLGKFT